MCSDRYITKFYDIYVMSSISIQRTYLEHARGLRAGDAAVRQGVGHGAEGAVIGSMDG